MSMKLVQLGLSGAAMFDPSGAVLQPSEVLYKKHVLVERGSFRPVCHVNMDMLRCARENFEAAIWRCPAGPSDVVELMELTMRNLREEGARSIGPGLSCARRHAGRLGQDGAHLRLLRVLPPGSLSGALHQPARRPSPWSASSLRDLFDEKYYAELEGGILESFETACSRVSCASTSTLCSIRRRASSSPSTTWRWRRIYRSCTATWSTTARSNSWRTSPGTTSASFPETLCERSAPETPAGNRWCRRRCRPVIKSRRFLGYHPPKSALSE